MSSLLQRHLVLHICLHYLLLLLLLFLFIYLFTDLFIYFVSNIVSVKLLYTLILSDITSEFRIVAMFAITDVQMLFSI